MPKLKTKRGAAKRFRKTGSGKIKRSRANRRHILTTKGRKRKRQLRRTGLVDASDMKSIQRQMPYS
jgi:large subunit ribosomal protein L35